MSQISDPSGMLSPAAASGIDRQDREDLDQAITRLRASRGVIVRGAELVAGALGRAATTGLRGLEFGPNRGGRTQALVELALQRAFAVAVLVPPRPSGRVSRTRSRLLAVVAGAMGGFAGVPGFLPDLAFTTLLIMRSIAAVARAEGEDLATEETRRACLEVFAFGSAVEPDDNAEVSYWSARLLLQGRPLVMLFSEIAARFGLQVSQKFALQSIPLVGAAGGAAVNAVFVNHYVSLAQVHFTMRRLERRYGREAVREEALHLAGQLRGQSRPGDPLPSSEPGD